MSAQNPNPAGDPAVVGPHDPEHDPRASYALEPEYVAALTARLMCATRGTTAEVRSPLNDAPLAHIPQSTPQDVAEAFPRARKAQLAWARTPVADRAAMLLRLHDLVLDRQDEIVDLIVWENGKARKHAFDEPLHVALTARYYGRTAPRHLGTQRSPGVFPVLTRAEINRVPKGVVGIISPWNYPFDLALIDGLAAIVAGNAVVTKPDAQTMLSALLGAELLERGRASRRTSGRSSPDPARRSAARSSSAPTTSASPAPPRPARDRREGLRGPADRLLAGARRQEPAARAPRRRPGEGGRGRRTRVASPAPASSASRSSGCSWPTRSTTGSSSGSWPAPRR